MFVFATDVFRSVAPGRKRVRTRNMPELPLESKINGFYAGQWDLELGSLQSPQWLLQAYEMDGFVERFAPQYEELQRLHPGPEPRCDYLKEFVVAAPLDLFKARIVNACEELGLDDFIVEALRDEMCIFPADYMAKLNEFGHMITDHEAVKRMVDENIAQLETDELEYVKIQEILKQRRDENRRIQERWMDWSRKDGIWREYHWKLVRFCHTHFQDCIHSWGFDEFYKE